MTPVTLAPVGETGDTGGRLTGGWTSSGVLPDDSWGPKLRLREIGETGETAGSSVALPQTLRSLS